MNPDPEADAEFVALRQRLRDLGPKAGEVYNGLIISVMLGLAADRAFGVPPGQREYVIHSPGPIPTRWIDAFTAILAHSIIKTQAGAETPIHMTVVTKKHGRGKVDATFTLSDKP